MTASSRYIPLFRCPLLTSLHILAASIRLPAPTGLVPTVGGTLVRVLRLAASVEANAAANSQGGALSSFYRSFGHADGTQYQNDNMAPDGIQWRGRPPVRRADNVTVYEYRTAVNRTIRSITGPLEIGSVCPNQEWQNNLKVKAMLARRQDDDRTSSKTQMEAAGMLEKDKLGATDKIVEQL
ncbi:hypothetical protein Moror_13541 [Moniliophthora roreri MCA 2997]|uniref:Uncharacterized protein n=1 Tax=Moniliophthora roreri (strain MCA 2997) TaxID=1381753 RepID=V2WUD0_MONRO|nr:hypothetical protein Moror_13541 [Moniliophthora roreri MCA 2997]